MTPPAKITITPESHDASRLSVVWTNGGGSGRRAQVIVEEADGPMGAVRDLMLLCSEIIEMCRVE